MTRTASTLRRKLAVTTALGVTLGVFAAPAAAQLPVGDFWRLRRGDGARHDDGNRVGRHAELAALHLYAAGAHRVARPEGRPLLTDVGHQVDDVQRAR